MRVLLDTQIVLWQLAGTRSLGPRATSAIEQASEILFSVVSFAEIGVKASVGKLVVPPDIDRSIANIGVAILGLDVQHCLAVADLPLHHRDPFDRLLIAQAKVEQMALLSADERFADYAVDLVAAVS